MYVYLAGYSGRAATDLRACAEALNALVVDVRLNPNSRRPEWRKTALVGTLRARYLWLPDWGNLNYMHPDGPVNIRDFAGGLSTLAGLQDWGRPLILLCVCRDLHPCHRSVLADDLAWDHGATVYDLDWDRPDESRRLRTQDAVQGFADRYLDERLPPAAGPYGGRPGAVASAPVEGDDLPARTFADTLARRRSSLLAPGPANHLIE